MTRDETKIRAVIENWAKAVRARDLDSVLADHAPDIVMFDAPPPKAGVRGIDAYRETWPPFFEWIKQGATFDIVSLDVVAGADVAFAHALLRCGTISFFEWQKRLPDREHDLAQTASDARRRREHGGVSGIGQCRSDDGSSSKPHLWHERGLRLSVTENNL